MPQAPGRVYPEILSGAPKARLVSHGVRWEAFLLMSGGSCLFQCRDFWLGRVHCIQPS